MPRQHTPHGPDHASALARTSDHTDRSTITTLATGGRVISGGRGQHAVPDVMTGEEAVETKRERFYRIIEPRVNRCVHDITLLAYGADRNRYDPSETDIAQMEQVLHNAVDSTLAAYRAKVSKPTGFVFGTRVEAEDEEAALLGLGVRVRERMAREREDA